MDQFRDQVIQDLGPSIPEVSFEWFKAAVLPVVEDTKLTEVYNSLKNDQELSDEGWTGLDFEKLKRKGKGAQGGSGQVGKGQGTPALGVVQEEQAQGKSKDQTPTDEDTFYKPLAGKFNKVLKCTNEVTGKPLLITFSSTPTKASKSEGDNGAYRADINASLLKTTAVGDDAGKANHECDVVMAGEFKKLVNDKVRNDNVSKLVGNVNHLMGSDPTRRFAYGLTIEHTDTRFWFFSRSHIFVTEKLDLQKNIKDVIYFVMALGSAGCNAELGFDPTVRRVQGLGHHGKRETRYRYKVDGHEYETVEPISVYKAKFLLGRAPRVFKVQRVENGVLVGPTLVLKDLWLPEGAKTELEVQRDIKDNINKVHVVKGLNPADFEKYFVAINHCEIVKVPSMTKLGDSDDDSTNALRGKTLPSVKKQFCLKLSTSEYKRPPSHVSGSQVSTPKGSVSGLRAQTREMHRLAREHYGNKAHHRILMEDAGKPLDEIRELRTILLCIGQASTGLLIMFSAGMVHRDISTGNLLVSEIDGELRCKITDLEYAKKVGESSQSPQDVKTGTPFFIALEIEAGNYLFSPGTELLPESETPHDPNNVLRSIVANESTRDEADKPSLVRYNYLHDLESLFWILMYFLFIMHPADDELDETVISLRMRKFRKLFPSSLGFEDFPYNGARIEFLRGNAGVQSEFASSVPVQFRVTLRIAILIANFLKKEYERVEALSQSALNKYSAEPYKFLHSYLEVLASAKEGVWLGKVVEIPEKPPGGTSGGEQSTVNAKRKAEELSSSEGGKRSRQD